MRMSWMLRFRVSTMSIDNFSLGTRHASFLCWYHHSSTNFYDWRIKRGQHRNFSLKLKRNMKVRVRWLSARWNGNGSTKMNKFRIKVRLTCMHIGEPPNWMRGATVKGFEISKFIEYSLGCLMTNASLSPTTKIFPINSKQISYSTLSIHHESTIYQCSMGFRVSCTYGARACTQQTQAKSDAQYWPTRLDKTI